jgi:AcrR family transcriptional regulator
MQIARMPPKPAPYHREALERDLLKHAAGILKRGGIEALSLRELGRAADVSRSAPYHYFEDKAALLQRLGADGFGQLAAAIRKRVAQTQDPAIRLKLGFQSYYDFALRERHLFELMFANVLTRDLKPKPGQPPFAFSSPQALDAFALMLEGVGAWLATRPDDRRDPAIVVNIFWAFVHGVAVLALDQNVKHGDPYRILDAGLDALMA